MGLTFIASKTAPTDADSGVLRFVHGEDSVVLDSTYDEYLFYFVNLHPSDDAAKVMWRSSTDGGSSYGVATTSTFIQTYHSEAGGNETFSYNTGYDAAQGTGDLYLSDGVGYDNDQSASGLFRLYAPASDTYIKNFMAEVQHVSAGDTCNISRSAGYVNTTDEVDAVKFFFYKSGVTANIDLGTIYMYGVS